MELRSFRSNTRPYMVYFDDVVVSIMLISWFLVYFLGLVMCDQSGVGECKGCNSCVLCSAACNTTLHSTAPMCTATQHLTGIYIPSIVLAAIGG